MLSAAAKGSSEREQPVAASALWRAVSHRFLQSEPDRWWPKPWVMVYMVLELMAFVWLLVLAAEGIQVANTTSSDTGLSQ